MITLNIYQLKCNRKTYEGYYKYGNSDWVMGQHTAILGKGGALFMFKLMQGDCLELMKDIPDGSVDMILCDLPYGTTACKWDSIIPFEPLWEQYNRIIKDNGAIGAYCISTVYNKTNQ